MNERRLRRKQLQHQQERHLQLENKIKNIESLTAMRTSLPVQRKVKRHKFEDQYQKSVNALLTLFDACEKAYQELPRVVQNAYRNARTAMAKLRK